MLRNISSLSRKNAFNIVFLLLNENSVIDDKFKMISEFINDVSYDAIFDSTIFHKRNISSLMKVEKMMM